jgi:uncharacterized DUF497 family protein
MPFYFFVWDDENERHIAEHDISVDDFEEVVCNPYKVDTSWSSGRQIAFGYTSSGEYIACVYELIDETTVYPVTAYPV